MQPRIYVVCEMAYRFNIKHGEWIKVPSTVTELRAAIQAILDISPIPGNDWLILDYEGFSTDCHIQKNEDLETVVELAAA